MTRLLISEITHMGAGFCVIGVERQGEMFRSIRPLPPRGAAWLPFPHKRGDIVEFPLQTTVVALPHIEDRKCSGVPAKRAEVSESELVGYLRRAEVAEDLPHLFGCGMRPSAQGGSAVWAHPSEARRSICGLSFDKLRFRLYPESVRAALSCASGESLRSLPLVDRDWREFLRQASGQLSGANRGQRMEKFLNGPLLDRLLDSPDRFARIGITRADENGCCWLMLDSLFPGPRPEWLEEVC